MGLEQKLSLKLAQKLVMTPSLQQAIKLLQMTRLELEGVLNQELVENPVLEENEQGGEDETPAAEAESKEEPGPEEAFSDIDLDAYFGDQMDSWEGRGYASVFEERQGPPLENTLTREDDLYDHLLWQLHMMDLPDDKVEITEAIVGNLDPDGFLVASVDELRAMGAPEELAEAELEERAEQGWSLEAVEEALAIVRGLDPPGVACRDLRESLLAQLEADDEPEDSLGLPVGGWRSGSSSPTASSTPSPATSRSR